MHRNGKNESTLSSHSFVRTLQPSRWMLAGLLVFPLTIASQPAWARDAEAAAQEQSDSGAVESGFSLDQFSAALTRLARQARPSVVSVQCRSSHEHAAGSGVIFDELGHIVTSNHVVDGAPNVDVVLADGRKFEAKLIGKDPKTDVAVLRIDATGLTPARFADSTRVEVGNLVLAIGSPFMLAQTVSHGIVSATSRSDVDVTGMVYQNFIQTDAPTNPGNSGGALVNTRGEVIGINTAIASESGQSAGVAFATPSNTVVWAAKGLISGRPLVRGFLGVTVTGVSSDLAKRNALPSTAGVLVQSVTPDSPAARAGLQPQDIVLQIQAVKVCDRGQFQTLVAELPPGARTPMLVWREGQQRNIEVVIGEQPRS